MLYMTTLRKIEESRHICEHRAGEELLRHALKEEYGIKVLPVIERGTYGKPYFPNCDSIYFNISHAGYMVVCAVAQTELGVDIEAVRPIKSRMPERVLTELERDWLARREDKEDSFIRLWTLKESYVKATGEGLSKDFREIEFSLSDHDLGDIACNQKGYYFFQKKVKEHVYMALCAKDAKISEEMKKMHILF